MAKRNEQRANKEEASDAGLFNVGVMYPHDNVRWISALDKLIDLLYLGCAEVNTRRSEITIEVSECAEEKIMPIMQAAFDISVMIQDLYGVELRLDVNLLNKRIEHLKLIEGNYYSDTEIVIASSRVGIAFVLMYAEQRHMIRNVKEVEQDG